MPRASINELRALVFLAAFLLFTCEPLVAAMILPLAGGGAHVWASALMFFQGALLVGYLYCHWIAPRLGRWHFLVACVPMLFLPLAVPLQLDPEAPVLSIVFALITRVGAPFVVLATTSVLTQTWLVSTRTRDADNPYPLYAASNAGSLVALLSYPVLIAPRLSLSAQAWVWSAGYVGFLALMWRCMPHATTEPAAPIHEADTDAADDDRSWGRVIPWLLLSAAPSALLLAVTNVIEQDIGSAPLIWVIPLGVYLSSFVLIFRDRPIYPPLVRRFWLEISAVGLFLYATAGPLNWWVGAFHVLVLLVVCVVAHAALYEIRPPVQRLTAFYVSLAVGGWAGAAFVVLLAPRMFTSIVEYPVALLIGGTTVAWTRRRHLRPFLRSEPRLLLLASAAFLVFVTVDGMRTHTPADTFDRDRDRGLAGTLYSQRNAYGVHRVTWAGSFENRTLVHGTTVHGSQNLDPQVRRRPTTYYARESPLGDVLDALPRPRRMGAIGLGVGTVAAYLERGESITFYELDPDVVDIANRFFTYLADCPADVRVVTGDGRVRLADPSIPDAAYDVILVDAFSSDAIPAHLLTREAVDLYFRKLDTRGYLIFHITNRYHELRPVLRAIAQANGVHGAFKSRGDKAMPWERASLYFVMVANPGLLEPLLSKGWTRADDASGVPMWRAWTDDYVDLWQTFMAR